MTESSGLRILVVEDDDKVRKICVRILDALGHDVSESRSAADALSMAKKSRFDILLTDFMMPGMTGDELVVELKQQQPHILPIMMTAFPSTDLAITSLRQGVYEFLTKPFDIEDLRKALDRVTARREEEARRFGREFADALVDQLNRQGDEFDLFASIHALLDVPESPKEAAEEDAPGDRRVYRLLMVEPAPSNANLLKTSPKFRDLRTLFAATRVLNRRLQDEGFEIGLALVPKISDALGRIARAGSDCCGVVFGPNLTGLSAGLVQLATDQLPGRPVVVCQSETITERQIEPTGAQWFPAADDETVRARWSDLLARRVRPSLGADLHGTPTFADCAPDEGLRELFDSPTDARTVQIVRPDADLGRALMAEASRLDAGPSDLAGAVAVVGPPAVARLAAIRTLAGASAKAPGGFDADGFILHQVIRAIAARLLTATTDELDAPEACDLRSLWIPEEIAPVLRDLDIASRADPPDGLPAGAESFLAGLLDGLGLLQIARRYGEAWNLVMARIENADWHISLSEAAQKTLGVTARQVTATTLDDWDLPSPTIQMLAPDAPPSARAVLDVAEAIAQIAAPWPSRLDIDANFRRHHLAPVRTDRLPNPLVPATSSAAGPLRRRLLSKPPPWETARAIVQSTEGFVATLERQVDGLGQATAALDLEPVDAAALGLLLGDSVRSTARRITDHARGRKSA